MLLDFHVVFCNVHAKMLLSDYTPQRTRKQACLHFMCMFNTIYLDHIDILCESLLVSSSSLYIHTLRFLLYHHRLIICLRHKQSK